MNDKASESIAVHARTPRFLRINDVLQLPDPAWLIEDLMATEAFVVIYGQSNTGKSFCCLDWALSVASGKPWNGKPVKQGAVLYVYAEGRLGLKKRVAAWRAANPDANLDDALFAIEAVPLCEAHAVDDALRDLEAQGVQPVLIVIDTFAASFSGDENSSQEMKVAIDGIKRIQHQTRATVVVVHHTTKKGNTERGSGAMRAAADTMVSLIARQPGALELEVVKQRDAEVGGKMRFVLKTIATPHGQSCVLATWDQAAADTDATAVLDVRDMQLLRLLPEDGDIRTADWFGAYEAATNESDKTAERKRKKLIAQGLVAQVRTGVYRLTDAGRVRRDSGATTTPIGNPTATDTDTPRRGVSGEGEVEQ